MNVEDIAVMIEDRMFDYGAVENISSFEDAGVLTTDEGIVLRMTDGSEFYITMQQKA